MRVPRPRHQPRVPAPREHQLVAEVRVDGGEVCDPVIHRGRVPVRVKRAAEVVICVVESPRHAGPRSVRGRAVLCPQDLVHAAEDAVAGLIAGAEGGAGVDLLASAGLRILPQLGQADELLVEAGVLLNLMSSASNLHFDSVLFLLFEEVVLPAVMLVIACKGCWVPGSGAELPAHGGVRSPVLLRMMMAGAQGVEAVAREAINTRRKLRESF